MKNWIASSAFPCLSLLTWISLANSAIPRHGLDAGDSTAWLRRETFETEPWKISQAAPSATFGRTLAMFMEVTAKSSLGGGDSEPGLLIHNCSSNNKCEFSSCSPDGSRATCHNGNCFTSNETDNATCAGESDGTAVPPDEFCLGGYPTKMCPPQSCVDVDVALAGTSCSALKALDPAFCQQASLQSMINIFCRFTCGLCTLATCDDKDGIGAGTSAVQCPSGSFRKAGAGSAECADTSCETSGLESIDTSTCCELYACSIGDGQEDCKTCMPQNIRTTNNHCSDCNAGSVMSPDGTACLAINKYEAMGDDGITIQNATSSCLEEDMCCPDRYKCTLRNGTMICVGPEDQIADPVTCNNNSRSKKDANIFISVIFICLALLVIVGILVRTLDKEHKFKPALVVEEKKDVLEGAVVEEGKVVEEGNAALSEVQATEEEEEASPVTDAAQPEAPDPELPTPATAPPP